MEKTCSIESSHILLQQIVGVSFDKWRKRLTYLYNRINGKAKTVLCGDRMSVDVEQAYLFPPRNRLFFNDFTVNIAVYKWASVRW